MPILIFGLMRVPSMMERTAPPPRLEIVDFTGRASALR